ncbi:MAG: hypothetical protein ACRD19_06600 [Terriglobia bacterium]
MTRPTRVRSHGAAAPSVRVVALTPSSRPAVRATCGRNMWPPHVAVALPEDPTVRVGVLRWATVDLHEGGDPEHAAVPDQEAAGAAVRRLSGRAHRRPPATRHARLAPCRSAAVGGGTTKAGRTMGWSGARSETDPIGQV